MTTPVITLGRAMLVSIAWRVLFLPGAILILAIVAVIAMHQPGWLSVGGSVISAIGARHWAARLFRSPKQSAVGLSPMTLPETQSRSPLASLNPAGVNELQQQATDNWRAYLGVWMSIAGGIIGSAGPFVVDLIWRALNG